MNTRKKAILTCMILLTLSFIGCSSNTSDNNADVAVSASDTADHATESTVSLTEGKYGEEKLDASWDEESSSTLAFDNNTIASEDTSIQIKENTATITQAGTYLLTGTLTDGQIIVDAPDKSTVKLVLNNAVLTSNTSSPIYIKSGDTVITLADGTDNRVTDAAAYGSDSEDEEEPNAAIFAKDDLTFNGTGTLTVTGNYNHAIQSKDALKFISGTYSITSVGDGVVGKDSVSIKDGNYTIESGEDGIKSTNIDETDKGYIIIENGDFQITSVNDGIQAETLLLINDGEFQIQTGGGTDSSKALKSYVELTVKGGTYSIDSRDDSLHSNQNLTIDGGTFHITSGDDGIHADALLTINNGSIDIQQSYEGIEGFDIIINDGTINILSSDDGINAAGDDDSASNPEDADPPEGPGKAANEDFRNGMRGGMAGEDEGASLTINGGSLYVNAEGDGLDANGSILITGGTTIIHGPSNGGNGALDYASGCQITGGTFFAVGSSGMAQNPDESSTQPVIVQNIQSPVKAGTTITVSGSDGTVIADILTEKEIQWYAVSSPELRQDSNYNICIGDAETTVTIDSVITQIR